MMLLRSGDKAKDQTRPDQIRQTWLPGWCQGLLLQWRMTADRWGAAPTAQVKYSSATRLRLTGIRGAADAARPGGDVVMWYRAWPAPARVSQSWPSPEGIVKLASRMHLSRSVSSEPGLGWGPPGYTQYNSGARPWTRCSAICAVLGRESTGGLLGRCMGQTQSSNGIVLARLRRCYSSSRYYLL